MEENCVDNVVALVPTMVECPRCGMTKEAHPVDKHLCADCVHAENNRLTYYRQHQGDWIAKAKDAGLDVWLQQPEETQWEYTVWVAYRDSYPGKRPSYGTVAEELHTSRNVVGKIAQRWSFPMRMQAWMRQVDDLTMTQRRQEILGMNARHIDMAARLDKKLSDAIDALEPALMKPSEISSLMKTSAELERKARIDSLAQDEMISTLLVDTENPSLKKSQVKQDDLGAVMQILMNAGALGDITHIGVRKTESTTATTTTELVVNRPAAHGSDDDLDDDLTIDV